MPRLLLLAALLGLSAALKFRPVYEWNLMDYNWASEEIKNKALNGSSFTQREIEPWSLAVHRDKMFISLSRFNTEVPSILNWIPLTNPANRAPNLTPFPSLELQEFNNSRAMQDVRGLKVDSLGRLWAVDNGFWEDIPGKLWIFDLNNNESVWHAFPSSVVDVPRELNEVALDPTGDDWLAYVSDLRSLHLLVFSLARNASWSVDIGQNRAHALAISPRGDRTHLFIANPDGEEVLTTTLSNLRAGERNLSVTAVGRRYSKNMVVNQRGFLYSDCPFDASLLSWDMKLPFKDEAVIYQLDESLASSTKPLVFNLDAADNLWLMVLRRKPPIYQLLKADTNV